MVRFNRLTFYSIGAKWIMAEYSLIHITCDELRFFRLSFFIEERASTNALLSFSIIGQPPGGPKNSEKIRKSSERIKIDHV